MGAGLAHPLRPRADDIRKANHMSPQALEPTFEPAVPAVMLCDDGFIDPAPGTLVKFDHHTGKFLADGAEIDPARDFMGRGTWFSCVAGKTGSRKRFGRSKPGPRCPTLKP